MKKKDIILISLDTLRADVAYSGKFKTIEQLRSSGVSFLNTIFYICNKYVGSEFYFHQPYV